MKEKRQKAAMWPKKGARAAKDEKMRRRRRPHLDGTRTCVGHASSAACEQKRESVAASSAAFGRRAALLWQGDATSLLVFTQLLVQDEPISAEKE